ncbi:Cholesterol 25-hydroxylase-like protein [Labeo rohita]|uniref:Cholesterol 25-hydroxylase-like protein n=1 Tax=Labeo rohita TaxID=84645 RepID=A0ABQ8MP19_LABRO|nr:cholesterol 25-hydroxylase-like protein [Labeo rohita]KAI2664597.1 Cholesterol 25-hydroxylase-like protein [Labeo rohita]
MIVLFLLFFGGDAFLRWVWDFIYAERHVLLRAPHFSVCTAFSTHIIFSAPFMLLDVFSPHVGWLQKYRIHREVIGLHQWFQCAARILWKYMVGVLPLTALFLWGRRTHFPERPPSSFHAFRECASCMLIFDTLFFLCHYTIHKIPWLFNNVHRIHHLNRDTFALAAQDASISELLSLQTLAFISTMLVGCHPFSEILFHLVNTWMAVEDHCGYDFPWALHRFLPFFGGPPHHLAHHQHFKGNYAPYFRHWDYIFGTSLPISVNEKDNR